MGYNVYVCVSKIFERCKFIKYYFHKCLGHFRYGNLLFSFINAWAQSLLSNTVKFIKILLQQFVTYKIC